MELSREDFQKGHRDRLRRRFERNQFDGFAPHEALELLLTLCIPRRDVKPLAYRLIHRFGSLKGVLDASLEDLKQEKGMGSVSAIALHIIKEAATLYLKQGIENQEILNSIQKLADFWRLRLSGLKHEGFEVAFLNNRYELMTNGIQRLQEGDIDRAVVYPRRILAQALKRQCVGLILAHNHPAGEAYPSEEDRDLTHAMVEAAQAVGLTIVDHIIVAGETTFSFREVGLLKNL